MISLKVSFKAVKDNNNPSGRERKVCRYFKELDEIIGNCAAARPPEVLESSITIERATEDLNLLDDEQEQAFGLVVGGGGNSDGEDSLIQTPSTVVSSNIREEGEDNSSRKDFEDGEEHLRKKLKVFAQKRPCQLKRCWMDDGNVF